MFGYYNYVEIIQIPDSVKLISHSAFKDVKSLEECIVGQNVLEVEEDAFYGCTNLSRVELPQPLTFIHETAFKGCGMLTIYCPEGSYAEQFARKNGISCVTT